MMLAMQWLTLSEKTPHTQTELLELLLENRGLDTPEKQQRFLTVVDPATISLEVVGFSVSAVNAAVQRLHSAIEKQEKVLIFGDYDVDGVTATAIAWEGLRTAGLIAKPFIPHRQRHGYGLSIKALDEILAEFQPDLVLTVDNGIVAHPALAHLAKLGIPVIVTDHHLPDDAVLPTVAMAHTTELCGAGVAWFLIRELLGGKGDGTANQWLDLVALATVADQMPVLGANRDLIKAGLKQLKLTQRPGLKALFDAAGLVATDATAENLSFGIIPRLNAMGRLADGIESLRLLCARSEAKAMELAQKLQETNVARQDMTQDLLKIAELQAEQQLEERIIVVLSPDFHEGVIGLLAGKLMERYSRPAIAIQVSENLAKASMRSVPGVNGIELLRQIKDSFWELGGHALAAGFGSDPAQVTQLQKELFALAKKNITAEQLVPVIRAECRLDSDWLKLETYTTVQKLEPFGQLNRKPIFQIDNVIVKQSAVIGKQQQHLRLTLQTAEGKTITALAWQKAARQSELNSQAEISVLAELSENVWRDKRELQLILKDWR